jgi:hypothetical protein
VIAGGAVVSAASRDLHDEFAFGGFDRARAACRCRRRRPARG